jgi:hypothetical protein
MSDPFIPSSPQDFPVRPVMKGMITSVAPTQAPDGSFSLVRNLDVTVRGMRRLGGWALGIYQNASTPLAIPFLVPNERVEDMTLLTSADGTFQNMIITNRFLYQMGLTSGYKRIPWVKRLEDGDCWRINNVAVINGKTTITLSGNFISTYLRAGDYIQIDDNPNYYISESVSSTVTSTIITLSTTITPTPTINTKFVVYKPFNTPPLSFVDFCLARNSIYLVDSSSDLVFQYNGQVLLPLIITDDDGNQTVAGAETITFYGERLYFGNVIEGYTSSVTSYYRNRVRWTDVLDFSKSPASYYQDVSKSQGRIFKLVGMGPLLMAYTPTEVYYARPTNLTNLPYAFAKLETGGAAAVGAKAVAPYLEGQIFVSQDNVYFVSNDLTISKLADAISYNLRRAQGLATYTYCRIDTQQSRILIGTSLGEFVSSSLFIFNIQPKAWSVYDHLPLVAPSLLTLGKQLLWKDVATSDTWTNSMLTQLAWATVLAGDASPTLVAFQADGYMLIYNAASNINTIEQNGAVVYLQTPIRIETPDYDLGASDSDKTALRIGLKIFEQDLDRITRTSPIYLQVAGSIDGGATWRILGILRIAPQHNEDALNFRLTGSTLRFRIESIVPQGATEANLPIYEITEMSIRIRDRSVEVFRSNVRPSA